MVLAPSQLLYVASNRSPPLLIASFPFAFFSVTINFSTILLSFLHLRFQFAEFFRFFSLTARFLFLFLFWFGFGSGSVRFDFALAYTTGNLKKKKKKATSRRQLASLQLGLPFAFISINFSTSSARFLPLLLEFAAFFQFASLTARFRFWFGFDWIIGFTNTKTSGESKKKENVSNSLGYTNFSSLQRLRI